MATQLTDDAMSLIDICYVILSSFILFLPVLNLMYALMIHTQVGSWDSNIGVVSCLKWAPRRIMFAAAASSVLTFWIPSHSKPETLDSEARGLQPPHIF